MWFESSFRSGYRRTWCLVLLIVSDVIIVYLSCMKVEAINQKRPLPASSQLVKICLPFQCQGPGQGDVGAYADSSAASTSLPLQPQHNEAFPNKCQVQGPSSPFCLRLSVYLLLSAQVKSCRQPQLTDRKRCTKELYSLTIEVAKMTT